MNLTGVTIRATWHARERCRERIRGVCPSATLADLFRQSEPRSHYDAKRHRVAGEKLFYRHPSGVILVVQWVTPERARIVTVFYRGEEAGAA